MPCGKVPYCLGMTLSFKIIKEKLVLYLKMETFLAICRAYETQLHYQCSITSESEKKLYLIIELGVFHLFGLFCEFFFSYFLLVGITVCSYLLWHM